MTRYLVRRRTRFSISKSLIFIQMCYVLFMLSLYLTGVFLTNYFIEKVA